MNSQDRSECRIDTAVLAERKRVIKRCADIVRDKKLSSPGSMISIKMHNEFLEDAAVVIEAEERE